MRIQRVCQGVSLGVFLGLLTLATYPLVEGLPVDLLLRMDPVVALGTVVAERAWVLAFLPALIVLLVSAVAGRVFCGHVCPMGTTLDILQSQVPRKEKPSAKNNAFPATAAYRSLKYLLLAVIVGAAVLGVSLVHVGSPISLVTRFYGIAVYPLLLMAGDWGLFQASPIFSGLGLHGLALTELTQKVFSTNLLVSALFVGIALLAWVQPRFWCRNLCPAGGLMALLSRMPLIRRTVDDSCTRCGRCAKACPTGAIEDDPHRTAHQECIVCLKCEELCPESAISFSRPRSEIGTPVGKIDLTRRSVMFAAGSGIVTGGLLRTSLLQPRPLGKEPMLRSEDLVRAPGSVPEPLFLSRCIRCGECMKACPTNTLQPTWLKAGLEGIFSPVMVPRLAACAVNCNVCGKVCPTGAIRDVGLVEKRHAKVGTAWIVHQNCLAWEQDKKCLVCDEVCPYDAVEFRPVPGKRNGVPFVLAHKCVGCGWCECKCPVTGAAAIRVNIIGEIRIETGSYVEKAKEYGMIFQVRDKPKEQLAPETFDFHGATPEPPPQSPAPQPKKPEVPPGFITD
ncbi:MAG: 4Fe-4S binding protein [Thermodesulfobacteriota bacterium]